MQSKQKYYFYLTALLGILFFLIGSAPLFSQKIVLDSIPEEDSMLDTTVIQRQYVRFSKDSLSAPIDASCKDSMILDNKYKKLFLYGEA
ncbi:MAG: hypothetical protein ACK5BH_05130, partial [Bacteroidota bacterium]